MSIEVQNITKIFGDFTALKDVSLHIPAGELTALLGPSGSGKTTLLRIISGLEVPDAGTVFFHGEDMNGTHARDRKVGFVFQHYALFRHMSVYDNVAFGLEVLPRKVKPRKKEIREKVHQLLSLVQLDRLGGRFPSQLSGGQRQRVALARALAVEPKVLLLDEPFGSLDARVRRELRHWLRKLHDEIHVTSVFVTHDQEEALEVADRVVVMNEGRIEQVGTPDDVYHHPATPFVYNFLGNVNLFHARVEGGKAYFGDAVFDLPQGQMQHDTSSAMIYVRPHLLDITRESSGKNDLKARIIYINMAGPVVKIELLSARRDSIQVEISQEHFERLRLKKHEEVYVRPKELKVFTQDYSI
ncbi:MAG: sulfate ABC transporter ATP-binding protein [Candidatus Omnitrophica bacterium]|nr:sulfate ABC transporter ATP-binding protein [Candidatus Omnitrophota bacterium]